MSKMVDEQQAPEEAIATAEPESPEMKPEVLAVESPDVVQRSEVAPEPPLGDCAKQLEDARSKAEQHWEQVLRARAEMENLQKRQARELENAHKFALDSFVRELLTVWDSLELGQAAAQDPAADVARLREGMELTLKQFGDVMAKFGVQRVDPVGEAFNPDYHQAMSMQPSSELAPNHVLSVLQKGYTLNGRLVRPALVIVSQAA
jgi:molecular chaperone GrpE